MTVPAVQTLTEVVEGKIMQDTPQMKFSLSAWCSVSWRKIVGEFISTSMLVLFGCMTCIPIEGIPSAIYAPLGFGTIVMFNIQIFGHISGAHMNPAVTTAGVIFGNTDVLLGISYIIVQCLGGIVGYGVLMALVETDLTAGAICITAPHPDISSMQAVGIEVAITSALILLTCALWDPVNKNKQDSTPIKFGLTILGLSLVGAPLTGASLNPARTLAPAVWTNIWTDHWVYWVGPLIAGVVPTYLYKLIFLVKQKD